MAETTVEETRNTPPDGGLTTADLAAKDGDHDRAPQPTASSGAQPGAALFSSDQAAAFKSRWQEIQVGFVDEPRQAVERADGLVAEVMKQLAQGFADERAGLESQWNSGQQKETEELRQAFRHYRSFFDRLLTV